MKQNLCQVHDNGGKTPDATCTCLSDEWRIAARQLIATQTAEIERLTRRMLETEKEYGYRLENYEVDVRALFASYREEFIENIAASKRIERIEACLRNLLAANEITRRVTGQIYGFSGSTNAQLEAEHEAREVLKTGAIGLGAISLDGLDAYTASGADLDGLAEALGVKERAPGETDEELRARVLGHIG